MWKRALQVLAPTSFCDDLKVAIALITSYAEEYHWMLRLRFFSIFSVALVHKFDSNCSHTKFWRTTLQHAAIEFEALENWDDDYSRTQDRRHDGSRRVDDDRLGHLLLLLLEDRSSNRCQNKPCECLHCRHYIRRESYEPTSKPYFNVSQWYRWQHCPVLFFAFAAATRNPHGSGTSDFERCASDFERNVALRNAACRIHQGWRDPIVCYVRGHNNNNPTAFSLLHFWSSRSRIPHGGRDSTRSDRYPFCKLSIRVHKIKERVALNTMCSLGMIVIFCKHFKPEFKMNHLVPAGKIL